MSEANIVIIGAGVSGLTTALLLSRNPAYKVTIVAKHMPGDYDAEYASPWAGANFLPVSNRGTDAAEWDKNTWYELRRLERDVPEAGIHMQDTIIYNRTKDASTATADWFSELLSTDPWFKDILPDFKVVPKEKLAPGVNAATTFKSVSINTAIYLPWLASQCLKGEVVIKRAILKHISEAKSLHHSGRKADLVVNCTGLLASQLGGVMDKNVIPARGQLVHVRNDPGIMITVSGTDDGDDEATYIIPRAAGGGTILGGSYEKGRWESQPDPNLAQRIMKRCIELAPALTNGKGVEALSIIRHSVGLRPVRIGGVRLEKEMIDGVWTVHNYGHGGFGFSGEFEVLDPTLGILTARFADQASWGCAQVAVRLVEDALGVQARL